MKYRADVDGLRALAVLPVLLFHGGFSWLSGGYVGVDIFFVISGFVIASKLVEELEAGRFSIAAFYVRRIRRIIPALTATILFSYFAAMFLFLPDAMQDFSRSVEATAAFVSNLYFWKSSGYFETAALDRPLLHTWSLAIEEQFYLFIPIALYLAYRYTRRYAWLPFLLLAAGSLALSVFVTDKAPTANFFLLPTRAWELLMGVLLVLLPLKPLSGKFANEALAVVGLSLILYAITTFTDATPFPGLSALLPTLGAAVLIQLGRYHTSLVGKALSWRPMVGIGLISYSLYLVHWPIIVFARYVLLRNLEGFEIAAMVGASICLAYLSWRFIETPLRRPRSGDRSRRPLPIFAITASVLVGTIALGAIGASTRGFAARFPDYRPKPANVVAEDTWLSGRCFLENQDASAWAGDICVRTTGKERNALLWGDSFAAHYLPGLMKNADGLTRNIVQYTFAGCPPILSYASYARPGCQGFNAKVFDVIDKYRIDTVVMSARWDELRQRGVAGLKETVERLRAKGLAVYVLGQSPMFGFDVAVLDYRGAGARPDGNSSWLAALDPEENAHLRSQSGAGNFVDPLPAFCAGRACTYRSGTGLLFSDYGHYSDLGSDYAVRAYFPLYRAGAAAATAAAR
jgi:peptidoglycan/LPS O-acetylase OafA/YrhL